jgi:hypothetical protein
LLGADRRVARLVERHDVGRDHARQPQLLERRGGDRTGDRDQDQDGASLPLTKMASPPSRSSVIFLPASAM